MSDQLHPLVSEALEIRAEYPTVDELSPAEARDLVHEITADPDEPPVGAVEEGTIPSPDGAIPIRAYEPHGERPFPTLVYFHGGGWVVGDLDTHDRLCRELTNATGCLLVSIDYRRAPENPFPAAVEDCWTATTWLSEYAAGIGGDPDRLAVAGDSAGGTLATVVSLMARDRDGPEIDRQVLVYPAVDGGRGSYDSRTAYAEGYGLETAEMEWYYENYLDSDVHARNPYAFPMNACDLADLPPATVVTAGFDPLHDEGEAYAERLSATGVPVTHEDFGDVIHGFLGMLQEPFDLDRAHEAIDLIATDLAVTFED